MHRQRQGSLTQQRSSCLLPVSGYLSLNKHCRERLVALLAPPLRTTQRAGSTCSRRLLIASIVNRITTSIYTCNNNSAGKRQLLRRSAGVGVRTRVIVTSPVSTESEGNASPVRLLPLKQQNVISASPPPLRCKCGLYRSLQYVRCVP